MQATTIFMMLFMTLILSMHVKPVTGTDTPAPGTSSSTWDLIVSSFQKAINNEKKAATEFFMGVNPPPTAPATDTSTYDPDVPGTASSTAPTTTTWTDYFKPWTDYVDNGVSKLQKAIDNEEKAHQTAENPTEFVLGSQPDPNKKTYTYLRKDTSFLSPEIPVEKAKTALSPKLILGLGGLAIVLGIAAGSLKNN